MSLKSVLNIIIINNINVGDLIGSDNSPTTRSVKRQLFVVENDLKFVTTTNIYI